MFDKTLFIPLCCIFIEDEWMSLFIVVFDWTTYVYSYSKWVYPILLDKTSYLHGLSVPSYFFILGGTYVLSGCVNDQFQQSEESLWHSKVALLGSSSNSSEKRTFHLNPVQVSLVLRRSEWCEEAGIRIISDFFLCQLGHTKLMYFLQRQILLFDLLL